MHTVKLVMQLDKKGITGNVFTFIDSTAIKDGFDKRDNDTVDDYSADKDARFGCKGKKKYWYGFKRHVAVDMKSGIIKK